MTEEDISRLLAALEDLLGRVGLDSVVTQERVIAAEGTSLTSDEAAARQRLPEQDAALWDEPAVRTKRTTRLKSDEVVVTPLDVRARLALLLDLVEVATAGTFALEQEVLAEFRFTAGPDDVVTFSDPPEAELRGQNRRPWSLSDHSRDVAVGVLEVMRLVNELRVEAGVPRGTWLAAHDRTGDEDSWGLLRGRDDRLG